MSPLSAGNTVPPHVDEAWVIIDSFLFRFRCDKPELPCVMSIYWDSLATRTQGVVLYLGSLSYIITHEQQLLLMARVPFPPSPSCPLWKIVWMANNANICRG